MPRPFVWGRRQPVAADARCDGIMTMPVDRCPACQSQSELVIEPRLHDLGDGFVVRRAAAVPSCAGRSGRSCSSTISARSISPRGAAWMCARIRTSALRRVTYLYEGAIEHRDSLGSDQVDPARRRQLDDGRPRHRAFGAHAARRARGRTSPAWRADLARAAARERGCRARIPPSRCRRRCPRTSATACAFASIAGTAFGMESPVRVYSPTLYVDARFAARQPLSSIADEHAERAMYAIDGDIAIDGQTLLAPGHMHVLARGRNVELSASVACARADLRRRAARWRAASSGGTSSLRAHGAHRARESRLGSRSASARCRARRSSFRCRIATPTPMTATRASASSIRSICPSTRTGSAVACISSPAR